MEGMRNKCAREVLREVEEYLRRQGTDMTCHLPVGADHFSVGPKTMVAFLADYIPHIRPPHLLRMASSGQPRLGNAGERYTVEWQPGMAWHTVPAPVTSTFRREWHRKVEIYDRVMTIVWNSIMIHPTRDVEAMTDTRMTYILAAIRLLEGDIFQVAQTQLEYTTLLTLKTSEMRSQILIERRCYGDIVLQELTASSATDLLLQSSLPTPLTEEQNNSKNMAAAFSSSTTQVSNTPQLCLAQKEANKTFNEIASSKRDLASCETSSMCCRICFDTFAEICLDNRKVCSTVCGHIFCDTCIKKSMKAQHVCPTCRQSLVPILDVHPIFF